MAVDLGGTGVTVNNPNAGNCPSVPCCNGEDSSGGDCEGCLLAANNLSDLGNVQTALQNLGITFPISISLGGTGASDAPNARNNLGLEIGVDVQAYCAALADICALSLVEGDIFYVNATGHIVRLPRGTNGQWLTLSSNIPAWATLPTVSISYALLQDQKANGNDGGDFNATVWETRVLNTEVDDPDGIVTLAANEFTLGAGKYRIKARAPAYSVNLHKARLYNVTDAVVEDYGGSMYAPASTGGMNDSVIDSYLSLAGSKTFRIEHRCSNSVATNGRGVASSFGVTEVYTSVEILKIG